MNFRTPSKMVDLRHVSTGLSGDEIKLAILESRRMLQIRELGGKWLLDKSNAPQKGEYNWRGLRVA